MGGRGSGGAGKKTIADHLALGTLRPGRHLAMPAAKPPAKPATAEERQRVLAGLSPDAARIAGQLLDQFSGWSADTLEVLRAVFGGARSQQ